MEYNDKNYGKINNDWHLKDSKWKSEKVYNLIEKNQIKLNSIIDIGCGVGGVIYELSKNYKNSLELLGVDYSDNVIEKAKEIFDSKVNFKSIKNLKEINSNYDLAIVMDVFEHVENYYEFLKDLKSISEYKIFHIPLDICLPNIIFNRFNKLNNELGHLHYFNKETALLTLENCSYSIIDYKYTNGSVVFARSFYEKILKYPRHLISLFSPKLSQLLFGGFSLIVLTK